MNIWTLRLDKDGDCEQHLHESKPFITSLHGTCIIESEAAVSEYNNLKDRIADLGKKELGEKLLKVKQIAGIEDKKKCVPNLLNWLKRMKIGDIVFSACEDSIAICEVLSHAEEHKRADNSVSPKRFVKIIKTIPLDDAKKLVPTSCQHRVFHNPKTLERVAKISHKEELQAFLKKL